MSKWCPIEEKGICAYDGCLLLFVVFLAILVLVQEFS